MDAKKFGIGPLRKVAELVRRKRGNLGQAHRTLHRGGGSTPVGGGPRARAAMRKRSCLGLHLPVLHGLGERPQVYFRRVSVPDLQGYGIGACLGKWF